MTAPLDSRSRSLSICIVLALIAGIAVGYAFPAFGAQCKLLGVAFIKLIRMLVGPVIFCTIVSGLAAMENMAQTGRVAGKALAYFLFMSALALGIGMAVAHWIEPGAGMHIDPATLDATLVKPYLSASHETGISGFLLSIIPETPTAAFAGGEILPILCFAVLFGVALSHIGAKGDPVQRFITSLSEVLFAIIGMVMWLAPIGVFGAMAFTVGTYGLAALLPLGKLILCFYLTCALFIFVVLALVMRLAGASLLALLRYLKAEILIVFGTSSSETVLPRLLEKLTAWGCPRPVAGIVLPTGYSFNLDGTAIYLSLAALFLAQATDTPLSLTQELTLLAVMMLSSKGAAAVTGGGFIVLAGSLAATGTIPVASVALLLGIDRFMSEARAVTNMIGNAVATVVVARWEGKATVAT